MKPIAFIFFFMPLFLFGQEQGNDNELEQYSEDIFSLSIEDILNMDVEYETGSFLDLNLRNLAATMTIITKEQIEYAGARHLSELVEIYVPGFQYMRNKWNGIIWGMRGVAANRNTKVIFLVNGHKMNHESRDGAMSELDLGMLGDIERVEVLRGPSGLVYGSGAIAGVINVVTKEASQKNNEIRGALRTWGMQSGGAQAEVLINKEINNDFRFNVSVGARVSSGVGNENSRIYGRASWPYPFWLNSAPQNGVPTQGAAWSTPGNFKFGSSVDYKNLKFYTRITRQVTNASGYFPLEGWPDNINGPDSTAQPKVIDGEWQDPSNSFYASITPFNNNRRQYLINNYMAILDYKIEIGLNELNFMGGFDGVTNRIQFEKLDVYSGRFSNEGEQYIDETFGERRYNLGVNYHINTVEKLKVALGYQFRLFDIGNDMNGRNAFHEIDKHKVVSDVIYINHAWYAEAYYDITRYLSINAGLRYDLHTRTKQHGGVISPKLAAIGKINKSNVVKLIFQSSANNGSADNYEYNRWHYNDFGEVSQEWRYATPLERPSSTAVVLTPAPSQEELDSFRPEKAISIELASSHEINGRFLLNPSISYTSIKNLFVWEQNVLREFNGGKYNVINIDLEAKYKTDKLDIGVFHTIQKPINIDDSQSITYNIPEWDHENPDSTEVSPGTYSYSPVVKKDEDGNEIVNQTKVEYIKNSITEDNKHFLNLVTHVSKLYMNYSPSRYITLHTSLRVFWGLQGRTKTHEENSEYPDLGMHKAKNPIIKWNVGVHLKPAENWMVSLMVYDILASKDSPIHALRWQQKVENVQNDLYMSDLRSIAFNCRYNF